MALSHYQKLKEWRHKNWDKVRAQHRRYYWKHVEKERKRCRDWARNNTNKRRAIWNHWYRAHPKAAKNNTISKRYGISLDEYRKLLKKQDRRCAICGKYERARYRGKVKCLAVDHNHKSGEVRGLLCNNCNTALGHFHDDIRLLQQAIAYLQRTQ